MSPAGLADRIANGAPATLRSRMVEALAVVADETAAPAEASASAPGEVEAHWLIEAGIDRLRRVLASRGDRSAANELLAADALMTHAFDVASDGGPEAVVALVRAYTARLAELLPTEER